MRRRKPHRRAASPVGGVPMESLVRVGEASDLIGRAWELFAATVNAHDGSVAAMTTTEEAMAAQIALRQSLVFSITARRFLDGNVVG